MQGILFKPDMRQATIYLRKTCTRRLAGLEDINKKPDRWEYIRTNSDGRALFWVLADDPETDPDKRTYLCTPRYHVRETVYLKEPYKIGAYTYQKEAEIIYQDDNAKALFPWDEWFEKNTKYGGSNVGDTKWRSPMFLREIFARHFIRILDILPGRLQSITEEDAKAEGMFHPSQFKEPISFFDGENFIDAQSYRDMFIGKWQEINRLTCPWSFNPWVWRYGYKYLGSKPE